LIFFDKKLFKRKFFTACILALLQRGSVSSNQRFRFFQKTFKSSRDRHGFIQPLVWSSNPMRAY